MKQMEGSPQSGARKHIRDTCVFSIDVEDWFHILELPSTPTLPEWDALPSRVERNFLNLLDLMDETGSRSTCFFLGWVAEKFPHLVREAGRRGHEVASHGYSHQLAYSLTRQSFIDDGTRARRVLEGILGEPVLGYRAPGFSVTDRTPWFFDAVLEAGYVYDSSVFPATRGHGGLTGGPLSPHLVRCDGRTLVEFPISVARVLGRPWCFFGGGYFRIAPYTLIRSMARRVLAEDRPVIFYIHPREIDPGQPRLPAPWTRRFKSYVNLRSTEPKLRRLLKEFETVSFRFLLEEQRGIRAEIINAVEQLNEESKWVRV